MCILVNDVIATSMIKLILLVFTVLIPAGFSDGAEYHNVEGIKYFITYPMVHNWYEAMRFCIYNAMYPVSIHSYEEEQIVLSVIRNFKEQNNLTSTIVHFWTSGTDLGHNINEFYWTATGQPVIYKNWMPNKPSNSGGHAVFKTTMDCLLLNARYNYQWYDEFCELKYPVICQDKFLTPKRFNEQQSRCDIPKWDREISRLGLVFNDTYLHLNVFDYGYKDLNKNCPAS